MADGVFVHRDESTLAKEAHTKEALRAERTARRKAAGCCPTEDRGLFQVSQAFPLMDINDTMTEEDRKAAEEYNEKAAKANNDRDLTIAVNARTLKLNRERQAKRDQVDLDLKHGRPFHTGECHEPKEYHVIVGDSIALAFKLAEEFAAFKAKKAATRKVQVAEMAKALSKCEDMVSFQRLTLDLLTDNDRQVVLDAIALAMSDPFPTK